MFHRQCVLTGSIIYFRFFQHYTSKSSNGFDNLLVYRHVQLLANVSNNIQQHAIISAPLVECTIAAGVTLAFLVQTAGTPDNMPALVIMIMACVDSTLFLFLCLGTLAIVYKESRFTLQRIKVNLTNIGCRMERRWTRKFLRSCSIIKMKFGENNFVDELTPLNCLSHALQICMQVLLVRRTH